MFTSIFNENLAKSVVPTYFKKSVVIPVPNNKPACLNDYHPVVLTSLVMKVLYIVMLEIQSVLLLQQPSAFSGLMPSPPQIQAFSEQLRVR